MDDVSCLATYNSSGSFVKIVDSCDRWVEISVDDLAVALLLLMAIAETRHSARVLRDA